MGAVVKFLYAFVVGFVAVSMIYIVDRFEPNRLLAAIVYLTECSRHPRQAGLKQPALTCSVQSVWRRRWLCEAGAARNSVNVRRVTLRHLQKRSRQSSRAFVNPHFSAGLNTPFVAQSILG